MQHDNVTPILPPADPDAVKRELQAAAELAAVGSYDRAIERLAEAMRHLPHRLKLYKRQREIGLRRVAAELRPMTLWRVRLRPTSLSPLETLVEAQRRTVYRPMERGLAVDVLACLGQFTAMLDASAAIEYEPLRLWLERLVRNMTSR